MLFGHLERAVWRCAGKLNWHLTEDGVELQRAFDDLRKEYLGSLRGVRRADLEQAAYSAIYPEDRLALAAFASSSRGRGRGQGNADGAGR